ncbi:MAG: hypothetical protein AMXMBFR53_41970 [Gemmatimonadota bacterium]
MTAAEQRDGLGAALGFRQDRGTGLWWGRCPTCKSERASVGIAALSCDQCGPLALARATQLYLGGEAEKVAVGTLMSAVDPVAVSWLWPGRIPLGRLTILDGDPGLGKSSVTLDLAARVTSGSPMPDHTRGLGGPRGVILMGVEDGLADTVRPRLDAAGADATKVWALTGVRNEDGEPRLPTLQDVRAIREARSEVDAALLVVDPLSAFLGSGVDGHRDGDVRQALARLAALAEETGLAVLCVRHLSKAGGANPLYRGGGSIAIIAAARSGLLLAADPDDPERRVLASTKSNLAPPQPSLALRIATVDGTVSVAWEGLVEVRAVDLLQTGESRTLADEARDLLRHELADGPRLVPELQAAARKAGVTWATVKAVKTTMGIESSKTGGRGEPWVWKLPGQRARAPGPPLGSTTPYPFGEAEAAEPVPALSNVQRAKGAVVIPLARYSPETGDMFEDSDPVRAVLEEEPS